MYSILSKYNTIFKGKSSPFPTVLKDGNTVAWYDSQLLSTITKDESDFVSRWNDRLGSGRDLLQAVGANQPKWVATDGILFDGISQFMKVSAFTFNQPEMIYIVFRQCTWSALDRVFDGDSDASGLFYQVGTTPELKIFAGTAGVPNNNNLSLNTFGIVRILFNGLSSKLIINQTTPTTGDAGSANMGGFTLATLGSASAQFGNIQVKEIILRKVADGATDETAIYNYLSKKYGI